VPLAANRTPSVERIQDATCEHFGLTREQLVSRSRAERVAWARQTAMYLSRELTDLSLPQIAREFGGRDHTTVLHACRRVTTALSSTPAAFRDVEALTHRLTHTP
jgi:chromosomal replication initiator protein